MIDKLFNSIVFRIGSMMFIISFVAIISMFSSVFISELADKDALAINHTGSMRMQAYKILADIELLALIPSNQNKANYQKKLQDSIKAFSDKLTAPVLNQSVTVAEGKPLLSTLKQIQPHWTQQLQPQLTHYQQQPELFNHQQQIELAENIASFVDRIDYLVLLYQQHAESRILMIRMIQGISLFITIILVTFTMVQLNRRVEKPLSELTRSAKQIMSGDYTAQSNISQTDELGLLANTMNKMTQAISQSHRQLEKRVIEKTAKLRQSNDSLELLYQISQKLNQSKGTPDLTPIITTMSQVTGIQDIDLCLMTSHAQAPYEHIVTDDKPLPEHCIAGDCSGCLSNDASQLEMHQDTSFKIRYPLVSKKNNYGVLVCSLNQGQSLQPWQHQLFKSVAEQIAIGLKLREQNEQSRRITLLKERNVIARELHDSLAQALSYLKIQVTRLQKMRDKQATEVQIDDVVLELKTGLNSAYRQLRELLTTFRLTIDDKGLYQTFLQTLEQLNQRANGKMHFNLDYQIEALPLTPNEEIHLMQIAREATQNTLHHSQASQVEIRLFSDQQQNIHLIIEDNGVGIPEDRQKLNHYGLAIMQERSSHLNGELTIENKPQGGVKVELSYQPSFIEPKEKQMAV